MMSLSSNLKPIRACLLQRTEPSYPELQFLYLSHLQHNCILSSFVCYNIFMAFLFQQFLLSSKHRGFDRVTLVQIHSVYSLYIIVKEHNTNNFCNLQRLSLCIISISHIMDVYMCACIGLDDYNSHISVIKLGLDLEEKTRRYCIYAYIFPHPKP